MVYGFNDDKSKAEVPLASETYAKFGLSFVGNYGAIEKDSSINWQDIIDQIADVSETIDFGNGQWYFSESVVIPASIRVINGNGCVLTATSEMEYMFDISNIRHNTSRRFFFISNIAFDGANKVNKIINCDGAGNAAHILNCSFRDFNQYGIWNNALGAVVSNCFFANQTNKNTGCGIYTKTDSIITSCKFFYTKYGVAASASTVSDCYFFTQDHTEPTFGICAYQMIDGTVTQGYAMNITGCEFDCITYCVCQFRESIVSDCQFYWNGTDDTLDIARAIFYSTGANLETLSLIDCSIDISVSDLIEGTVETFASSQVGVPLRVICYQSYGCTTRLSQANALSKMFVTCGFRGNMSLNYNTNGAEGAPNNYMATHFTRINSDVPQTTYVPTFKIKSIFCDYVLAHWHYSRISAKRFAAEFLQRAVIDFVYKRDDDFYITVHPFTITEVMFSAGVPFNMAWAPVTTQIDRTGYTTKTAVDVP